MVHWRMAHHQTEVAGTLRPETHGQEIMAAVTLMPGAEAEGEELVGYARERVAAYKFPRRVVIVEALPLGPSGKVLKRELVAVFEAETTTAS